MNTKLLKQKILDLAIRGKLVPQDPNDEPASELLKRIRTEKEKLIAEGKIKRSKKTGDKPHYENENTPFEIPESWEWVTLGDISNYGQTKHTDVLKIPEEDWVLELEDIEKDSGRLIQTLSRKDRKISGVRCEIECGQILYSKLRTYLNKVLIAPQKGFCTTEIIPFYCFGETNHYYIASVLRSQYFIDYTTLCCYGCKMPRLSTDDARKGMIPLPPIAEQKRIVLTIKHLFLLIDSINASKNDLQEAVDRCKTKVLDLAIRGKLVSQDLNDEPAINLLKRINPAIKPCDTSHYENLPKGWCVVPLKETGVQILNGFAFKSPNYVNSGIKVIRITNVQDGYVCDDDPKYYPLSNQEELDKYMLYENDLLMSLTGNVGRVGFLPKEMLPAALNQRVGCLRGGDDIIDKNYLYYYLQCDTFKGDCMDSAKGVAQLNISTEWLKAYPILLPPINEQKRIAKQINTILRRLDEINADL